MVVRDYNSVIMLMNEFEKNLFKDHLRKINESVNRGTTTLKWNSQGTLDNFVKECSIKCKSVHQKILEFKNKRVCVNKKIKEISERIKFISFDPRKVVEIGTFLMDQENTRE